MTDVIPAVIGLSGVVVGSGLTALTTWWQTGSLQKAKVVELELQLEHERTLRREGQRHQAAIEVFYQMEKVDDYLNSIDKVHCHGDYGGPRPQGPCDVDSRLPSLLDELTDAYAKHNPLLSDIAVDRLEFLMQYMKSMVNGDFDIPYKYTETSFDEYCAYGALNSVAISACNELRQALLADIKNL